MKLFLALMMLALVYVLGWHQIYGQFVSDTYKKYQWFLVLLSVPTTIISAKAIQLITEHFDQKTWPSRMFTFSIGIVMFTLLSSYYFNEKITVKTGVLILLSISIVLLQAFWK